MIICVCISKKTYQVKIISYCNLGDFPFATVTKFVEAINHLLILFLFNDNYNGAMKIGYILENFLHKWREFRRTVDSSNPNYQKILYIKDKRPDTILHENFNSIL